MCDLTDKQIDEFFNQESKFVARQSLEKECYEVVELMYDDWREVIDEPQEVRGEFATYEGAETLRRRLHVRWVLENT